jgi:hypothetical protein
MAEEFRRDAESRAESLIGRKPERRLVRLAVLSVDVAAGDPGTRLASENRRSSCTAFDRKGVGV